ncbi:MAG: hypothetical protein RIR84_737, partial [Bacteroidota bacterium]
MHWTILSGISKCENIELDIKIIFGHFFYERLRIY